MIKRILQKTGVYNTPRAPFDGVLQINSKYPCLFNTDMPTETSSTYSALKALVYGISGTYSGIVGYYKCRKTTNLKYFGYYK